MKCRMMRHFIRVYTVCYDKNNRQQEKYIFYLDIIAFDPSVYNLLHQIKMTKKKEAIMV